MKVNKLLPVVLLVLMALAAISIRKCKQDGAGVIKQRKESPRATYPSNRGQGTAAGGLDRTTRELFFTKHARCRMKCRHITQQEVKDILVRGTVNYSKSDLKDPRGPTYAVEGITNDRQRVRIIFAPKQQHLTVVTVIDLEVEYQCNCS